MLRDIQLKLLFQRPSNLKKVGFRLTLSSDESVATVRIPGLCQEADGYRYLYGIFRIFQTSRQIRPFILRFLKTVARFTLIRGVVEIERAMYDETVPKMPLEGKLQLGYVGKSSINTIGTLIVPSTGQKLLQAIIQFVCVNTTSRRPVPHPDWCRGKYANVAVGNESLKVQRTPRPADTHVFKVSVCWSDTDNYNHINWTTYVSYCVNYAIHDGIRKAFFKNVNKDVVKRGLRKISVGIGGENREGNKLTVHSWESAEDNTTVCCEIENAAGNVVSVAKLRYPSPLAKD
ncbi:uncharacterized protein LOC121385150 [Gigantopelta aegis]|uniref:uncharacterized protein LOC121385150 n=1 Tax=Gigantopelta aegis TaxID=1735272 RepID=UPI001B888374|nr:uncharacterized protein LOC121385150 [Gigantopelta aegis]